MRDISFKEFIILLCALLAGCAYKGNVSDTRYTSTYNGYDSSYLRITNLADSYGNPDTLSQPRIVTLNE
jgi:hypothetical protein